MEKRKEILQKCKTPSTDCDNVLVPKVNDEIWSKLPANAQTLELQHYKTKSVKVSSAIMCTTDNPLEHIEKESIPLINPLLDSVARSCFYRIIVNKIWFLDLYSETAFLSPFAISFSCSVFRFSEMLLSFILLSLHKNILILVGSASSAAQLSPISIHR